MLYHLEERVDYKAKRRRFNIGSADSRKRCLHTKSFREFVSFLSEGGGGGGGGVEDWVSTLQVHRINMYILTDTNRRSFRLTLKLAVSL